MKPSIERLEGRDTLSQVPVTNILLQMPDSGFRPDFEEIRQRVEGYFAPFALPGKLHVLLTDSDVASQMLHHGKHSARVQTFVVELRDESFLWLGDADTIATPGENHEGRARIYLAGLNQSQVAFEAALVSAHEVGHLLGLEHVANGHSHSLMTEGTITPFQRFMNRWLPRTDGSIQNDVLEVWESLRGG